MIANAQDYLPIVLASALLVGDVIGAAIVFFILRNRQNPQAPLIAGFIFITGLTASILLYYFLSR